MESEQFTLTGEGYYCPSSFLDVNWAISLCLKKNIHESFLVSLGHSIMRSKTAFECSK